MLWTDDARPGPMASRSGAARRALPGVVRERLSALGRGPGGARLGCRTPRTAHPLADPWDTGAAHVRGAVTPAPVYGVRRRAGPRAGLQSCLADRDAPSRISSAV